MAFGSLFAGLIGYLISASKARGFEEIINNARERVHYLEYFKVVPPMILFEKDHLTETFYKEAVLAYILGPPNSSIITALRVLEKGLRLRLNDEKSNLAQLIDEVKELRELKDLAHGLRILRNQIVHRDKESDDRDALEVLRHVSEVLNHLYPFDEVIHTITCSICKNKYEHSIKAEEAYLCNIIKTKCKKCRRSNVIIIGKELGIPKTL
ncbi:MAG: DUF4145 domain-containing protein [archaeon GB-1867-035]|nr:DUF4145 domain-containing protein [Candidatus Culexmicrobium profundum]